MRKFSGPFLPLILLSLLAITPTACTRTVTVTIPPQVDLHRYRPVGLIDFSGRPEGDLGREATRKFLGNLQSAQPGIPLLELGSREKVLQEVGFAELDYRAVRAIGEKFGVAALIAGEVELSEMRPEIQIGRDLASIGARAKIDGRMSAKLYDAGSGAVIWGNDSWGNWTVAGASLNQGGRATVGYQDPAVKRSEILLELVRALNGAFWPTCERRKVAE